MAHAVTSDHMTSETRSDLDQLTSDPATELVLFLLGKTGHGKSSTGNTILERHAFATSDDSESQTYMTQSGWCRRGGRVVQVVDGPGVCETRLNRGDAAKKMISDMSRGVFLCPDGFDALVIVCRYGIRFTEEEFQSIAALKSVFGANFIKDFGVIVFTHGEELDLKNRKLKQSKSFEDWCESQTGRMRELMDECENRCLLFRNMDDDSGQVYVLLDTVARLKQRGVRYTQSKFQAVKAEQEKFFIRENADNLRAEIQSKVSLIQDGLNRLLVLCDRSNDKESIDAAFEVLLRDITAIQTEISIHDKGTGVLDSLKECVGDLELQVNLRRSRIRDIRNADDLQKEIDELKENLRQNEEVLEKERKDNSWSFSDMFTKTLETIGTILVTVAPLVVPILGRYLPQPSRAIQDSGPRIEELSHSDDSD